MLDFEQHLGFSPDDGNGAIEALLVAVLVILIAAAAVRIGKRLQASLLAMD